MGFEGFFPLALLKNAPLAGLAADRARFLMTFQHL